MKALSIQQPWAWLIVNGYKPYENRTWNTKFRGEFLIHAGKTFDSLGHSWIKKHFPEILMPKNILSGGESGEIMDNFFCTGGIVGKGTLWDVATASSSPWFSGPYGFCIAHPEPLPFIPLSGKLGLFEVPDELLRRVP